MSKNAHPLRISLAAVITLLLFAEYGFASQTHIIGSKDTLYQIAKKYGTSVPTLCKANNLKESDVLKLGQTLKIPSASSAKSSAPVKAVKSSKSTAKSVYGICRRDGADVWEGNILVASLDKGTKFKILASNDDKYKIQLSNGKTGWILDNWVTSKNAKNEPVLADRGAFKVRRMGNRPSGSKVGNSDVVRVALSYRGARYSRGGMSSRGFDCSGFVKYVYAKKGIKLPHSSSAQFNCGKSVSRSELSPGDLVFFSGTYRRGISHVGMYIGGNQFIHASTSRGGVRVDDLNGAYYRRKYAGARRM
ncbi:MAG: C40 family peptidase [Armatimonadota bacterium]